MKRFFLTVILVLTMAGAFAQNGGVKGKVVSREGREAVGGVKVSIEGTTLTERSSSITSPAVRIRCTSPLPSSRSSR